MTPSRSLFILSNRAPFALSETADGYKVGHAAGGLASALAPMLETGNVEWFAVANSEVERRAAASGGVHPNVHYLVVPEDVHSRYYDDISNATLWFVHHGIYDRAGGRPFDAAWHHAWDAYRDVNRGMAEAVARAAPASSVVLVQDYHLALVGAFLARSRPDLTLVHFSHTPFAAPDELAVLPRSVCRELLQAMTAYRACGFHSLAWADAYCASAKRIIGESPRVFTAPLGPDVDSLRTVTESSTCLAYDEALDTAVHGRRLILRVDRLDPAKNLVRGFRAFDELLEVDARWREQVVFLALATPSRQDTREYNAYRAEVEAEAARINKRWGVDGWAPVVLIIGDSLERSMAALKRYDLLLVNSVRDGLNLVAKEGPLVNQRDGVLVLSMETGAWETMSNGALGIDPLDVFDTRVALQRGLDMGERERAARAAMCRHGATLFTPRSWLDAQLDAAGLVLDEAATGWRPVAVAPSAARDDAGIPVYGGAR